jgi:hypothetical protein
MVILLFLAGMTTATLSIFARSLAPQSIPPCHKSERPLPSPKPADHSCCAIGHQHALLTKVVSNESAPTTLVFAIRSPLTVASAERHQCAAIVDPSPSTAPPLRI